MIATDTSSRVCFAWGRGKVLVEASVGIRLGPTAIRAAAAYALVRIDALTDAKVEGCGGAM